MLTTTSYEPSDKERRSGTTTSLRLWVPRTWLNWAFRVVFSLSYGFALQALPVAAFKDRLNYLGYAEHSVEVLIGYVASGITSVLANEPVWLATNIALAQFLSPELVVRTIIFSGAAVTSYVLLKVDPRNSIWLAVFLLLPQLLKNYITHLRQGLAIAVFFTGYFWKKGATRYILMGITPFIHSSFFFMLPLTLLPGYLRKLRVGVDIRLLCIAGFALICSLSLGAVASFVGARQSENYEFTMADVSGLGLVYWLLVAVLFASQGKSFLRNHEVAIGILLFYLTSYFLVEVTARIFESGLIIVLLAGLALEHWRRWAFISSFLLYGAIQLAIRLASPNPF